MALKTGTRVGPYEILAPIGAGGMGEVYRARDTKLGRDVALKTLPGAFRSDEDRLARFRREAHVLASVNHHNIAAIYGLEESAGTTAIVLELVEGPTLADRINAGAIPADEALPIARQIAEALEAAHAKDVLHRDLKPANIKITPDGNVKVLDFGLAKILDPSPPADVLSHSPTMMSATGGGVILGTAAYMSPEQARGKALDKRTDVWSFGAMLFEMLAGKPAFTGETVTDVLGAIVHKDPDWEQLPPETPHAIRRLLRRCLARDARQRLHDIADARIEIEAVSSEAVVDAGSQAPARTMPTRVWLIAGVLAVAIAVAAFISGRWTGARNFGETTLWSEILPPAKPFNSPPAPALSPDGRTIAFNAPDANGKTVLWVRSLDSPEARALPGTEEVLESFWSPDSRSLAFATTNGKLLRIDVAGGRPQFIADAQDFRGGSWANDGTILFVPAATTVHRVAASGGATKEVTRLNASRHELIHGWPTFLPDGKHFLLWIFSSEKQNEGVYVGALDSPDLFASSFHCGVAPNTPMDTCSSFGSRA
jgi:serine/threonine protein kinase